MSYCRWSTNNFMCDIYAYESEDGYIIHVASTRVLGKIPKLPGIKDIDKFLRAHERRHKFLETAERANIGLPEDGKSFCLDTLPEFLEKMLELKNMGYRIPDLVIENIREEIASI